MSCVQRVAVIDPRSPQIIRLSPDSAQSGCVNRTADDGRSRIIDCQGGRIVRSNVARKWFVALSSCGSPRGLRVTYTLSVYGHIGSCPPSAGPLSSAGLASGGGTAAARAAGAVWRPLWFGCLLYAQICNAVLPLLFAYLSRVVRVCSRFNFVISRR